MTGTGELILQLCGQRPDWSNQKVAEEVRRRVPGAKTTAASVSSVKSVARKQARPTYDAPRAAGPAKDSARYRSMAIGNAQNYLVRNLLGRMGDHSFTRGDWERVRNETFGGRCAYCGKGGELEMEHVVPINKEKLGEHHLGNLVPACKACNSRKDDSDYGEFLGERSDRKQSIDDHMAQHGYQPLSRSGIAVALLGAAHDEVRAVADKYARLLDELSGHIEREPPRTSSQQVNAWGVAAEQERTDGNHTA